MATLQLLNSTSAITDHLLAGSHHPKGAALYEGVHLESLSWPEQLWAQWYITIGDPVLATGIMSFLMHEIVYFGRCIPWIIVGQIKAFDKYKIQQDKVPTAKQQWECTKYVLRTHFTVELPQIWLFHPMAEFFGMSTYQVPFPHWTTLLYQIAIFFVFEDMYHYFAHRALHSGHLYKRIHKLHHEHSAPFGLAAEYAHPLEIVILGTGTIGGPILWCILSGGNLHILTMYIWIVLRLFQAVDAHSGYDFPWSLNKIIPFWAGADHHDYHHEKFTNNFATSFRWMDWMLGTDTSYRAYRGKQSAAKVALAKGQKSQ